jgi:5-methylcytosine-specific restriction endonuclease McrA
MLPGDTKLCTRCGDFKPFTEFARDRCKPSGYQAHCKKCRRVAREATKEERSRKAKLYYAKNRDRILAYGRAYRAANRGKRSELWRRYYQANKERIDERTKRWRAEHPERVAASIERNRERHRERTRISARRYYYEHLEVMRARARERGKQRRHTYNFDLDKKRESVARRRARIKGTQVERIDRALVYDRFAGRCYLCGREVPRDGWHLEHIIPVSKGGSHTYTNVAVACPACNFAKAGRLLEDVVGESEQASTQI